MLLNACKDIGLTVNTEKRNSLHRSRTSSRLDGKLAYQYIYSNSYENVKTFGEFRRFIDK